MGTTVNFQNVYGMNKPFLKKKLTAKNENGTDFFWKNG